MGKYLAAVALLATISVPLWAQDSGFLSDYSRLSPGGSSGFTQVYIAPGAIDVLARYGSVMVDQPSFVISPDSKYKGVKPDDAVAVGEELRAALIEGIGFSVRVQDTPGEGAALISWAVSNIRLDKPRRGLLSYSPVGRVAHRVKNKLSDIVDKTEAFDVVFEVEGTDSATGQVLFAMVFDLSAEGEEAEWSEALTLANSLGQRIGCRLNNARLSVEHRIECQGIPIR